MIDQQKLELFPREIYLLEQFLSYDYYYETVKLCEELIQYAEEFYLKGGGIQIVLDPNDLVTSGLSKRKLTGWGYGTDTEIGDFSMVGVPTLQTKMGDYSLASQTRI